MPRRARMTLPGLPYHVVQRGNNREACFVVQENGAYPLNCIPREGCVYLYKLYTLRFVCALTS